MLIRWDEFGGKGGDLAPVSDRVETAVSNKSSELPF